MNHEFKPINICIRTRCCMALAIILAPLVVTSDAADSIILPPGSETEWGPQRFGTAAPEHFRMQQVINASQLFSIVPDGAWITEISFRDAGSSRTEHFGELRVMAATTARSARNLDSEFGVNLGDDFQTVFYGRDVVWQLESGLGSFDASISFQEPFLYKPTQGNLLFDLEIVDPSFGVGFDTFGGQKESTIIWKSSVFEAQLAEGWEVWSAPAIKIDFIPIPEPSPLWLLALGGFAAIVGRFLVLRRIPLAYSTRSLETD